MHDGDIVNCDKPKGGLAILWRNEFKSVIKYVGNSPNGRVMAATLLDNNKNLCILNVYLPRYNGSIEYECELLECLSYIEYVIQQHREIYGNIDNCICGDFNVDCAKLYQYGGSIRLLKEFINEHDIEVVTKNFSLNGKYTFQNDPLGYCSMIDNFLFYKVMKSRIEEVTIIDEVDDFSDHKPVLLKLNFCIRNIANLRIVNNKSTNWSNKAIKCYYANTGEQLYNLTVNDYYTDGMCCDSAWPL